MFARVGIMQGRLVPPIGDQIQAFPRNVGVRNSQRHTPPDSIPSNGFTMQRRTR